jgi:hypothetical protein
MTATPTPLRRVASYLTGVALLGTALAGVPVTADASPTVQKGTCSPHSFTYCANKAWGRTTSDAWSWGRNHPQRSQRRPVPYPASTSWNLWRSYHVVYVITYQPKGTYGPSTAVWKYGITRQDPWTNRAKAGVRTCRNYSKAIPSTCDYHWLAVTNKSHGFYYARFMEAGLIKKWNLRWGSAASPCPPGQRFSCR